MKSYLAATTLGLLFLVTSANSLANDPAIDEKPQQIWQVSPDLQISELQPGLWLHTSWQTYNGNRIPSNGLIIQEEASVLVIDTAWGETSTAELLRWIDEQLEVPVSAVISTHAHADRMGGARTVAKQGIALYAHPLGFPMAVQQGWPEPESVGDLDPGQAVTLHSVEVFYPGPAHTTDNIMIWLPEHHILVGGCAVKSALSKGMGNVGDANLTEWPISIERVSHYYPEPELVIPGHGSVGGQELLLHTMTLLGEAE